jgi:hypothetical protein
MFGNGYTLSEKDARVVSKWLYEILDSKMTTSIEEDREIERVLQQLPHPELPDNIIEVDFTPPEPPKAA